jgi:hypothetical protein
MGPNMSGENNKYAYRVTWSEDDSEYIGLCAEFPSLSWLARTPEAALKDIRKQTGKQGHYGYDSQWGISTRAIGYEAF